MEKECTPLKVVNNIANKYPGCWDLVNIFIQAKEKGELSWNEHCYIPIASGLAIASGGMEQEIFDNRDIILDAAIIAAAAPWRLYKQIFSFPAEMEEMLFNQANDIVIPIEVLFNLPYQCIYIQTKTITGLNGFFTHIESDVNDGRLELRLLLVFDNLQMSVIPIHLIPGGTIEDGINAMYKEGARIAAGLGEIESYKFKKDKKESEDIIKSSALCLMQLILYICAKNKEIEEDEEQKKITRLPKSPEFVKDKFREVRKWNCGVQTGKIVRGIYKESNYIHYNYASTPEGTGTPKSPHVRRGHWKHYWIGSKKDNSQSLVLKWISPLIVNADKLEDPEDLNIRINDIENKTD